MKDKKPILLITKDIDFRDRFISAAADADFAVDCIRSGTLAIEMLKDKSYYVIVADEDSEEMSPFAVLHRMNIMQYGIPVIITAENPGADGILLAYELGAVDMVNKSLGVPEVKSAVEKALTPQG